MNNERRINLRFTPEHFDRLDEKRFRARLSFQELGTRLFDEWLARESDEPMHSSLRKPANPRMEKHAILQAHGDKGLLTLVDRAIDMSFSMLQQSITPEELTHLRAVAYGEAKPHPKPPSDTPKQRRGRPRKIA